MRKILLAVGLACLVGGGIRFSEFIGPRTAHAQVSAPGGSTNFTGASTTVTGTSTAAKFTSTASSGADAYTCNTAGCRMSLGSTSRYMIDDGSYWTLNTGLNIAGAVVVNVYSASESGFQNVRTGTVGARTDPSFTVGRIIAGGINEPVWRIVYDDTGITERSVFDMEGTGTLATISDGTRRSMFESYVIGGLVYPSFRLNSNKGAMGLELGSGGSRVAIGQGSCSANVVTVTTETAHGFEVGQAIDVEDSAAGADTAMPEGSTYTIATVGSTTTFTANASACTNGTTTALRYVSADTNTFIYRNAQNGGLTLTSGIFDGASSASVAAFTLTTTNNLGDSDLFLSMVNQAGTTIFKITEVGVVTLATNLLTQDVRPVSDGVADLGTGALRYRHLDLSGNIVAATINLGSAVVTNIMTGTGTLDFPSTAVATCDVLTVTVTGAVDGDTVDLGVPNAAQNAAGSQYDAWVSASDTVSVKHCCNEAASCDPGSGTFRATIIDF